MEEIKILSDENGIIRYSDVHEVDRNDVAEKRNRIETLKKAIEERNLQNEKDLAEIAEIEKALEPKEEIIKIADEEKARKEAEELADKEVQKEIVPDVNVNPIV